MNTLKLRTRIFAVLALMMMLTLAAVAAPAKSGEAASTASVQISKKIRKELVTLPFYGVFDNLAYKFEDGTATLYGQVVRPTTRSDAGRRVAKLAGVERVVNNIEVLPLSSFDDDIRIRAYRTIFGTSSLYRYALGANPSVHIIVNRGTVTLEGVVANEIDSRLAYIAARGIPGVFSVTNNLRVENDGEVRRG